MGSATGETSGTGGCDHDRIPGAQSNLVSGPLAALDQGLGRWLARDQRSGRLSGIAVSVGFKSRVGRTSQPFRTVALPPLVRAGAGPSADRAVALGESERCV